VTADQPVPDVTRTFSPRWLAAGGAAALAVVTGLALLLHDGGSAACAAPPTGDATRSGKATYFDLGDGPGNCSFPSPPANDLFVALGDVQYAGAAACGSYLDVTGPKGKVRVKVIDSCPPCGPGHVDLSRTAFTRIADEVVGVVPITYRAVVNPPTPGRLTVRFAGGASRWWFAVLIDNHANPLSSVRVKAAGRSWRSAHRADDNYWVINADVGPGPFSLAMTDVYGHHATVTGIRLRPGETQSTGVRLTGTSTEAAAAHPHQRPASPANRPRKARVSAPSRASAQPSPAEPSSAAPPTLAAAAVEPGAPPSPTPGRAVALLGAPTDCR
jgi:expansin (peptidoglycan-binding protein)